MAKSSTQDAEALADLKSRLDWVDEDRRRTAQKLAEMEQKFTQQERELSAREQRVQDLEEKLSKITVQIARLSQVDTQLQQFKDEMVKLIEQYDQRRLEGQKEQEKLRRVEHEIQQREFAEIHRELTLIGRLQSDMELRQAEEARLSGLIGSVQRRVSVVENQVETWSRGLEYAQEAERNNARTVAEMQTKLIELSKRFEPIETRLEVNGHALAKNQARMGELSDLISDLGQNVKSWSEQVQVGEFERNKQVQSWRREFDERQEEMGRYSAEWVKFSDQYQEAKMAVQSLGEWQKQSEQQQREAAELARVEANRMRALWDTFVTENEKRVKNFEVDQEQRWSNVDRRHRETLQQLQDLSGHIAAIQEDKDALWRLQTAQSEAIKKWPRLWLEEVEKALSHDPNSRRQPALVPVREE